MAARTALFVIDIQNELAVNDDTRIPHAERIRNSGEKILQAARTVIDSYREKAATSPFIIVFVQHEDSCLVVGSKPWELVFKPRPNVEQEILISKKTSDTFESNPDLALRLRTLNIEKIVAFGLQSEYCVEATCKGALEAGFNVTLLTGAHSTYDTSEKTALDIENEVEERLLSLGAQIASWEKLSFA
ncbi:Isochorismatase-like protein [Talaromyces proteolyticus]|uniref:Isochorismatase-like protein n=1 Tax=Talaromyces proteolyticus TaxID=1131652 RepID=A0AAD4KRV9_9EURO|nr:Isochorismatase-like protein [Talaromyces proteolyticus]KAH8697864.1 Isochorismatase-like protein [Talaromyces proteolyticus]